MSGLGYKGGSGRVQDTSLMDDGDYDNEIYADYEEEGASRDQVIEPENTNTSFDIVNILQQLYKSKTGGGGGQDSKGGDSGKRGKMVDPNASLSSQEIGDSDDEGSYDYEDGEDGTNLSQGGGTKAKHKRRSKNDNQGRDFRCGCGKRYLSYPALYTHIKTKHNGETPKGTNTSQFQTGRGRGRPRKIIVDAENDEKRRKLIEGQQQENMIMMPSKLKGPLAIIEQMIPLEKIQAENEIFERLGVIGGPTNPREWFVESLDDIDPSEPLYKLVQEQDERVQTALKQFNLEQIEQQRDYQKATIYLASLSKEDKELNLKVDNALALYLLDVAEHVIVNFYRVTAAFVLFLRNCLNDLGWLKLADYKLILEYESTDDSDDSFKKAPPLFTAKKNACVDSNGNSGCDMIFQLSNEFVTSYLPRKCIVFNKDLSIKLTQHLCTWLSNRGFTQYKISIAGQKNAIQQQQQ